MATAVRQSGLQEPPRQSADYRFPPGFERNLLWYALRKFRPANPIHLFQHLAETYGRQRLEAACARAMTHASPSYRTVKTILAGGFDRLPLPTTRQNDFVYGRDARFQRDAQTLFTFDLDADEKTRH